MSDFYSESRSNMISTMQCSMKQIRQILNIGVQELADIIGVTRQTINNIESNKNPLSTVQYIAICSVIDHLVAEHQISYDIINSVLKSNKVYDDANEYKNNIPLLQRFFSVFPNDSQLITDPLNYGNYDLLFEKYKVFIDGTVFCDDRFDTFLNESAKTENSRFIIPSVIIKKIQKKSLSNDDYESANAKKAMRNFNNMWNQGIVEVRGEENDKDIANTFATVFAKFKRIYRLALITQDAVFAEDISRFNGFLIGFEILVLKISDNGTLVKWDFDERTYSEQSDISETEKDSSDIGFQLSDETNDTQILTDNEETTETVSDSNDWTPDFTNALKEWESI